MISAALAMAGLILAWPRAGTARSDDKPYLRARMPGWTATPLLTVGEGVARTSHPAQTFRMVGIPDGLGAYAAGDGNVRLFMNHELRHSQATTPVAGETRMGASISLFVLSRPEARILSGDFAFASVKVGDGESDTAGIFDRFCSGNLAGPGVGLTQPIYFAGEETAAGGFDGKGGSAVAVADGVARLLPDLGHLTFENIVVVPATPAAATVAFLLEDGRPDSCELYLYVGTKRPSAAGLLERNGLVGGKLYAFRSGDKSKGNEAHFTTGALAGTWVEMAGAAGKTARQLDLQAKAAGAFAFDRIEDGTYDRLARGVFYFAVTGGTARNPHGRVYKLAFDPANPAGGAATLEVLKTGGGRGGFTAPDNLDMNRDGIIMLMEDATDSSLAFLRAEKRNVSLWTLDTRNGDMTRALEIDESAVPARDRNRGKLWWEASGVIDAADLFGAGSWLVNVQAHSVFDPQAGALQGLDRAIKLVEGGQLLLIRR